MLIFINTASFLKWFCFSYNLDCCWSLGKSSGWVLSPGSDTFRHCSFILKRVRLRNPTMVWSVENQKELLHSALVQVEFIFFFVSVVTKGTFFRQMFFFRFCFTIFPRFEREFFLLRLILICVELSFNFCCKLFRNGF